MPTASAAGLKAHTHSPADCRPTGQKVGAMGSVIKKRRKRMAKKKHRKLLRKTRVARRKAGK
jgi:hypothetical protein